MSSKRSGPNPDRNSLIRKQRCNLQGQLLQVEPRRRSAISLRESRSAEKKKKNKKKWKEEEQKEKEQRCKCVTEPPLCRWSLRGSRTPPSMYKSICIIDVYTYIYIYVYICVYIYIYVYVHHSRGPLAAACAPARLRRSSLLLKIHCCDNHKTWKLKYN